LTNKLEELKAILIDAQVLLTHLPREKARAKEEVNEKHHVHLQQKDAELNKKLKALTELEIERDLILVLHKLEQNQEGEVGERLCMAS
jgi:hypothetical protein